MNPIDDMFRDGLEGRKGEVPADMWSRVSAGKAPFAPEGEGVDQYFSDALKDRAGDVPADMWNRIAASGVPAAASLDQVFADGLRNRTAEVPAGMWDRIWKARTAAPFFTSGRVLSAVAAVLLVLSVGWWILAGGEQVENQSVEGETVVVAKDFSDNDAEADLGSAAGARLVEGAKAEQIALPTGASSSGLETSATNAASISSPATQVTSQRPITNQAFAEGAAAENPLPEAAIGTSAIDQTSDADEASTPVNFNRATSIALPVLTNERAIPSLEVGDVDLNVEDNFKLNTPPASSFRAANRHRLQTEFMFGAFYANQQFSAETDDQRAQRNIREIRENPGLSYQVSLRGAYTLNDRLVLRSGLTYSEIRNKFDYEDVVNGRTVLLKTNNSIRQFEVPVLLGLRIPGRRLNVALNAGPLVNLTTSVQGRFLSPDSVEPLSLADDGQYRRNVGVGFMTSLSTTYVIGKKQPFVLLVEPFFKAYPGSFTRRAAPLRETYWAAGLQLGVRKGF
jgi:hypothetical protein